MPIPKGLTFAEASSLPEAYATSYLNLFYEGHLKTGQTAYIAAGASGLASVAIPMAKAFGARVITSVLSDEIAAKIQNLGADIIVNTSKEKLSGAFKIEDENGHPVNMAMDCLGGKMLGESLLIWRKADIGWLFQHLLELETKVQLRPVLTKGLHIVRAVC